MKYPFFSVVVVSLNAGELMKKTMESILDQTCEDYEIIVKDGLSKDDTLQYVLNNEKIELYSESDTSIYNAMNQAIEYTKGKYVIFMNCGDTFYSNKVLEKIKEYISEEKYGMVYGDYVRNRIDVSQPVVLTPFYMYRKPICHQSVFFNGDLLRKKYKYNEKYKIRADYDLELRLFRKYSNLHCDVKICDYAIGGVSETKKGVEQKRIDRSEIIHNNFSKFERIVFWIRFHITFPKIRGWILSDNNPEIIRKTYQKVVNLINK